MKKTIISTLIICIVCITIACSTSKYTVESIVVSKEYIINKHSKKVHSIDCPSAKRISSKNKDIITDSISNICNKGYVICKNCNAGFKNKNIKLKYELPTREDYISSVEEIGKWYVDNVATYQKEIEEEKINNYAGNSKYIKTYNLIDRKLGIFGERRYFNVISEDAIGKQIEEFSLTDNITRANENAIKNYKNNFGNISFTKNLAYYKCNYIDECKSYKEAGDDCVRFVLTVLNHTQIYRHKIRNR